MPQDPIISKIGILRETLEQAAITVMACDVYINITDKNTPGRTVALKQIQRFKDVMEANFKPENIGG